MVNSDADFLTRHAAQMASRFHDAAKIRYWVYFNYSHSALALTSASAFAYGTIRYA